VTAFKEFGTAFIFTHRWKSSFWDIYNNYDEKPEMLTDDEWQSVRIVGDKASAEVVEFLESIRDALIKKCIEYGYVIKRKSKSSTHLDKWQSYFGISESKRKSSKDSILEIWFGLHEEDYMLRRGIYLGNNREKNENLQKYWKSLHCSLTSKGSKDNWWDPDCLVFPNIPIKDFFETEIYYKEMIKWFDALFADKELVSVINNKK
jgi:hypothetical protein